jgi:hypothetical protein
LVLTLLFNRQHKLKEIKMKKIYIYASMVLLLIAANGCKKQLDQDPHDGIPSDDAFKTPDDFTNAIRGAYVAMRGAFYYGGQDNGAMISTPDVLADNLILNQQGRKSQQRFFTYKYESNNTWDLWQNAYTAILRSNFVLLNIKNLPAGDFKDNMEGEALAIRALAHFDLLRVYGKSYTSATDADPGVPYVTGVDPEAKPSRTPVKQAYGLVVADLVKASGLLGADASEGRFTKAAAEGILSRVYLYMGEWQKCVNAATDALGDVPSENELATIAEFPRVWTDASVKDVLFKIKNLDADDDQVGVGYKQGSPEGVIPEYSVDYAFFLLFKNTDVRKNAYIDQTTYNGFDFNYVYKYNGRESGDADIVDIKVIRTAEVYLNRAEANFNLNKQTEARADLNELRSNRYTDYNPATANETGAALGDAIQLQRRLELAFEGSRFFDLKRQNKAVQRSNFGDRADGTGIAATVKTLPAGSPLFQIHVPQAEINANPNVKQNTY